MTSKTRRRRRTTTSTVCTGRSSKAAVGSLSLLLVGLTGLMFPALLSLPAFGLLLGIVAWRNLRRYPDELTGRIPAALGLVGCLVLLVGGSAWHTYTYMTEVPRGVQPDFVCRPATARRIGRRPGELPMELDGKRIFVKGYVHPGVSDMGQIKKFILVPDMGTCCFGGQPKMTDMIEVTIVDGPGVRYTQRKRRLGGTLHVSNRVRTGGGWTGGRTLRIGSGLRQVMAGTGRLTRPARDGSSGCGMAPSRDPDRTAGGLRERGVAVVVPSGRPLHAGPRHGRSRTFPSATAPIRTACRTHPSRTQERTRRRGRAVRRVARVRNR